MYHEKRWGRWLLAAAMLALAVLVGGAAIYLRTMDDMAEQSRQAVKQAVLRCAAQCYATEGVYPPTLDYLEQNYGLMVNDARYIVSYEAFASNLPPDVKVLVR